MYKRFYIIRNIYAYAKPMTILVRREEKGKY